MSPTEQIQEAVHVKLREHNPPEIYEGWLRHANFLVDQDAEKCVINAPSKFISQYLQTHYESQLLSALRAVVKKDWRLSFQVAAPQGELFSNPTDAPYLRSPPHGDAQYHLFLPKLTELPIKDNVQLMEIAPFTLQPRNDNRRELIYENVDGMNIVIKALDPDYGLPTAEDYDIVLMMQSILTETANRHRAALDKYTRAKAKGRNVEKPDPPDRSIKFSATDILKFCRQESGSTQFDELRHRLNRLKATRITISAAAGRRKRRYGSFSLIADWTALMESNKGSVLELEINVPDWVYKGIVGKITPEVLTINPDYLLITQPLAKFLYRHLRKKFGPSRGGDIPLIELYRRSGTRQEYKYFARDLRRQLKKLPDSGLFFDWHITIEGSRQQAKLCAIPLKPPPYETTNT